MRSLPTSCRRSRARQSVESLSARSGSTDERSTPRSPSDPPQRQALAPVRRLRVRALVRACKRLSQGRRPSRAPPPLPSCKPPFGGFRRISVDFGVPRSVRRKRSVHRPVLSVGYRSVHRPLSPSGQVSHFLDRGVSIRIGVSNFGPSGQVSHFLDRCLTLDTLVLN